MKRKRLFFDIETSPNIGLFWTAGFKQTISPESIIRERAIICICWKWEGEKKVYSDTWDAKQCDKQMLKRFVKVANSADELVGHNGDRYDLAWIRTRCLFHGITQMFPTYVTIDTLKAAKAKFRFNSNKLDYIGKFLGLGGKVSTGGYGLWKRVFLDRCPVALAKMVHYCKGDVSLLEKVYEKLSFHIVPKTHFGVKEGRKRSTCPNCGSEETVIHNTRVSAAGVTKVQMRCKGCGKCHSVPQSALKK